MVESGKSGLAAPSAGESETNTSAHRMDWYKKNRHPESDQLLAADAKSFLHQSVSTPCMSTVAAAEGAYLTDHSGKRYLDFHGNNVHHIGYGHPRLKQAITRQMDDLPFAPRRFTCEPAVELAERLIEVSPPSLQRVLFTTGGSDAVEVALKLARAATGRHKTISFWDSFHGAGFGASSVGGEQLFRSFAAGPLLSGTEHVAPFACYRCPYGYPDDNGQPRLDLCNLTCANFVRYVLEKEGDVAAVIAEPARAVPYIPPPGFWKGVREACNDHGALLIFDEIPTGLGKTGEMFACQHDDVEPDILVMGKALGGGILPLAAVLAREELNVAGDFALGHYTHEKNPVSARAGLTTLDIIRDENLVSNARTMGELALSRMRTMQDRFDCVGDVRGRGLLLGLELVKDRATKETADDLAEAVFYECLENGLSFKLSLGNVLTLTPPLVVSEEQMNFAMDTIENAIEKSLPVN